MILLVLMCFCNIFKSPWKWSLLVSFACLCGAWGGCKYQVFLKHSEVVWVLFFVVSFVLVVLVYLFSFFFFKGKSKFHVTCTWIVLSKIFFLFLYVIKLLVSTSHTPPPYFFVSSVTTVHATFLKCKESPSETKWLHLSWHLRVEFTSIVLK